MHKDFPDGPVLQFCTSNAEGPGSIPGQGTRCHKPPLSVHMLQLQIPHAAIKIKDLVSPSAANKFLYIKSMGVVTLTGPVSMHDPDGIPGPGNESSCIRVLN